MNTLICRTLLGLPLLLLGAAPPTTTQLQSQINDLKARVTKLEQQPTTPPTTPPVTPPPSEPPSGAIVITPTTTNLLSAVPGAMFYFMAGTYNDLQVHITAPNQTYQAQAGAVLQGGPTKAYAFEGFDGTANNITIDGFIVDGYTAGAQSAMIQSGTIDKHCTGWVVQNCEVRNATQGGGINLFDNSTIQKCYIHHCDQIGFKMFGKNVKFLNNHVAYNNVNRHYAVNWEAGGCKFWNTTGMVCSGNEFDHNIGCGIWCDNDNSQGQIDHNNCHDNTYNGIYQEIGGSMVVENNTCSNNGLEFNMPGWLDGAGIAVEASHDVIVRNNRLTNNKNGIGLISSTRGNVNWQIKSVQITGNTISGTLGQSGCCWDGTVTAPWTGQTWSQNTYQGGTFLWQGKTLTLAQWQAAGNN